MTIEGIPDTMLAAQVVEFHKPYKISQVPTPQNLDAHELILKVAVASYCHTDSMVSAGIMGTKLPCIGSHEGTGTVVAVGSAITDFKKGDRVMAGLPRNRCRHCHDCLGSAEYQQYCTNLLGHVGISQDGAFAEYMVVDGRESCLLPDKVSFETAAPLACAGCTIFRAILQTGLKKGETVALVGAGGGLGHLGCQFAKALGLVVVGVDARDEGLDLARKSGADVVVDARLKKAEVVEQVQKVTNGMGADSTICISEADGASALACAITKMHGTMVQIAQPTEVSVPFAELVFRDIRIKGSLVCTRAEAQRMLGVVAEHGISVKTNPFFGLNELPKLLDLVHTGKMAGKGVIIVDEQEQRRVKEGKTAMV